MDDENRTIGDHNLTFEMNAIIDAIISGLNVKGFAYAGAGKSSLLRAVEKYHKNKTGLYICYNKSLEQEARTLFKGHSVHIATSHSFALNSFDKQTKSRFMLKINEKLTFDHVVSFGQVEVEHEYFQLLELNKNWRTLVQVVECFISTASQSLSSIHLTQKTHNLVNQLVKKKKVTPSSKEKMYEWIIKVCQNLSQAMLNPDSECPATQDTYIKYWQLSNPEIKYDYIMFDEAQDANPVLLSVILKQKCQQIFVGDKYQSIYQFRGGVNAMDIIPYEAFPLSNSFRYGESIGQLATKILQHSDPKVSVGGVGFDTKIYKGSDYNGGEALLYLSHTKIDLLERLISCYKLKVPTVFTSNKAGFTLSKIETMLNLEQGESSTLPIFRKYKNLPQMLIGEKDLETQTLGEWIETDREKVNTLVSALKWSLNIPPKNAMIHLSTAHLSKGLEYDCVMLADDFYSVVASFRDGKKLNEPELNLLYVAITRPKKTLILPDELYEALEKNVAFTLVEYQVADCLLDNLVPEHLIKSEPTKPKRSKPTLAKDTPKKKEIEVATIVQNEPTAKDESIKSDKPSVKEPDASLVSQDDKSSANEKVKNHDTKSKPIPPKSQDNSDSQKKVSNKKLKGINVEVGRCKETDKPLYWSPTNTAEFLNPNIAVIGTMGTGKTQTVKSMLTQMHQQKHLNTRKETMGTLIFDYKSDYQDKEFIKETNSKALPPNNLPINPFALFTHNRLSVVNTTKVFVSTISKIYRLGPKQEQTLKNCILEAYERKGFDKEDLDTFRNNQPPTIRDVFGIYSTMMGSKVDSLTTALSELYDFEVFEPNARKCKNLYELLEDNTITISLGGIDSSLQNLIVAILLDQFYVQMQIASKPKPQGDYRALKRVILVDECDNFLSQDFPSLRKILKEGREFGVGCILSTQGLDHFQTAENSYSDYMVCWIAHRLNNPKSKDIESLLNTKSKPELDERVRQLRELDKHHALFVDGRKHVVHQESTAFWKIEKTGGK